MYLNIIIEYKNYLCHVFTIDIADEKAQLYTEVMFQEINS